jgi:hypothetical protein
MEPAGPYPDAGHPIPLNPDTRPAPSSPTGLHGDQRHAQLRYPGEPSAAGDQRAPEVPGQGDVAGIVGVRLARSAHDSGSSVSVGRRRTAASSRSSTACMALPAGSSPIRSNRGSVDRTSG